MAETMEAPSLELIFKYARCFNGYEAFGGLHSLAEFANERLNEYHFADRWIGTSRELRGCLFFELRRWRHFGYAPDGDELKAIESLYQTIQSQIDGGDGAPNDPPSKAQKGVPAVEIDLEPCRLLEWRSDKGLALIVALDDTGLVVRRLCPPSSVTPDDPSVLRSMNWLFCHENTS